MEHEVVAPVSGRVQRVLAVRGETVAAGHVLMTLLPMEVDGPGAGTAHDVDLDHVRPDLAAVVQRHAVGQDEARPEAVARRRATGQRTARENVEDLCDAGTFVEYGPLVIAAQRRRRAVDDLIARTPADGLVAGVGTVNGSLFGEERARCVVMSYDYTVLAGTQGYQNHRKKDRLFELAERSRLPVVFFTEGGGGRPGDTDVPSGVAGLDCMAFHLWGRLSGLVPLVGINSGRCFAGNAAILGCCDVVIATADSTIGMGGPAMIEGGGLGVYRAGGDRPDGGPGAVRRRRHRGGRRSRGRGRGEAVPLLLPRPAPDVGGRRPAPAAHADPGEPAPGLRRAPGHRHAGRHRLRARAAPRVRARHGHDARSRGRSPDRHRGQRSDPPRRRHRHRRVRQGGPLHAAVRRLRPAAAVPLRHAGDDGGARRRSAPGWCGTAAACSWSAPT